MTIYRKGLLGLTTKTFINKESTIEDGLNIVHYDNEDADTCWVIADFIYNNKEDCWEIHSVCDRLNDTELDWETFGKLVCIGYGMLECVKPGENNE